MLKIKFSYLVFLAFFLPLVSFSQTLPVAHLKKPITAEFIFSDVEYQDMAVISNVLKIKNNNAKTYIFTVTLSLPVGWRTINNSNKEYSLSPNDSIFVPVRIITKNSSAKGGTKYNINAFIATDEGRQMAMASFRAGRPKVSDWSINVLPRPRIYFLNDENEAPFQINLSNNGDEPQDLILSMNKVGKDFVVADADGKYLKKSYYEFTLEPSTDTLLSFSAIVQKPERNRKRIDSYGYRPNTLQQEKHFGLYVKASEVGLKPTGGKSKNKKVDFVKLGNSINFIKLNDATRINQYGSATIPLTMVANINNLVGKQSQPIMNIVFNGNTQLNTKSSLNYFLQTGFTYYKVISKTNSNFSGIIGYNHQKGYAQLGSSVGLNMDNLRGITSGKGVSAGYRLTKRQSVGAYYVRNGQTFANYQSNSYGAAYGARFSVIQFGVGYGRTKDTTGNFSNAVRANIAAPIGKYQYVGASTQYSVSDFAGNISTRRYYGLFYRVRYLKNRANTSINYSYTEGISNMGVGFIVNNNYNNYKIMLTNLYGFKNGFKLNLINNYNSFQSSSSINAATVQNNILFNNILTFQLPARASVNYSPSIYLNYSDYYLEKMLSGGLQLNVNTYNPDENFRMGFFVKGGYNKLLNYNYPTFFNAQANSIFMYRTWNFNIRYTYGPTGQGNMLSVLAKDQKYPIKLAGSIGNQYQFKNTHFILENTINYTYLNVNESHNVSLFTQLYYYTNSGWRFNINTLYARTISRPYKYDYTGMINNVVVSLGEKVKNENFQLGIGVKKDFGIPIPKRFRKTRFCNSHYKVFLDVNGNKKFDPEEIPLENMVIRMNDYEVLTNEKGEASFINMAMGLYKLQVIPLVDVGAWFPVAPDSLDICGPEVVYIPFSKGVEILGNVVIDREKFSAGMVDKLDLSRIKIFLVDTTGKIISAITDNRGNFKFYVPFGQYRLKFDEKVLGDNFELAENDIEVDLTDGMESYYHTFFIIEKKRRVKNKKFGPDGSVIETEGEAGSLANLKDGKNDLNKNTNKVFKDESSSNPTNGNVENFKTFNKEKPDTVKFDPSKKYENVENYKTFGEKRKADEWVGNKGKANKKDINWAQMDSLINVLIGKTEAKDEISAEDLKRIEESQISKGDLSEFANKTVYTIQIGAYTNGLPKNILADVLKFDVKVESFKDPKDGLTKYFTGYFDTYEEATAARNEIEQRGLVGPFLISIHNGEIMSVQDLLNKQGK